jgi:hypothetical protein
MEPEPDRIDLSSLDPSRDARSWDAVASRVATRAIELRRLRRAVVRRGAVAVVLAAAAGLALWLSAPRRDVRTPTTSRGGDIFDWATRSDVDPYELFELGGTHAQ